MLVSKTGFSGVFLAVFEPLDDQKKKYIFVDINSKERSNRRKTDVRLF